MVAGRRHRRTGGGFRNPFHWGDIFRARNRAKGPVSFAGTPCEGCRTPPAVPAGSRNPFHWGEVLSKVKGAKGAFGAFVPKNLIPVSLVGNYPSRVRIPVSLVGNCPPVFGYPFHWPRMFGLYPFHWPRMLVNLPVSLVGNQGWVPVSLVGNQG